MYCLWIGAQKIYNLKQLKKHFDFNVVEMYLLGGGLSRWLRQCKESEIAAKVDKINLNGDISKQLSVIFSVKLPKGRKNIPSKNANATETAQSPSGLTVPCSAESAFPQAAHSFAYGNASFAPKSGSFTSSSFNLALYTGSFETASFNLSLSSFLYGGEYGSFALSSFRLYEYEYEYGSSFGLTSFTSGSFSSYAFDFGSFGANYYNIVNINYGKLKENRKKSYLMSVAAGLSPEEKIKLNISVCCLNRFGYGLHLI